MHNVSKWCPHVCKWSHNYVSKWCPQVYKCCTRVSKWWPHVTKWCPQVTKCMSTRTVIVLNV